jgi:aspartate/methionine/tyrosine aminotransferase
VTAARSLPVFPWDTISEQAELARSYPDGPVDLSIGTPIDPVPEAIQAALASAAHEPGYPWTAGTQGLREAAVGALDRRFGVTGIDPRAVLPTIGSKEFVAWLPTLLGLGPGDVVAIPELAYPTYEAGALLAGAKVARVGAGGGRFAGSAGGGLPAGSAGGGLPAGSAGGGLPAGSAGGGLPAGTRLVWLNSPSNPTGRVTAAPGLAAQVSAARAAGAVVASDECYLSLSWTGPRPVSVLHRSVCGGRPEGLLAVHSLSKSSNLAGYRAGFVAGDPDLVAALLAVRRHAGMIVPRPVQAAMTVALSDDAHLAAQLGRYAARRRVLLAAVRSAGFTVEHSDAGLFLWITRGEPCRQTLLWFAERGILVAPGDFYGPAGARHVRIALTATDERVAEAARRLNRR